MNRLLISLTAVALVFGAAACGKKPAKDPAATPAKVDPGTTDPAKTADPAKTTDPAKVVAKTAEVTKVADPTKPTEASPEKKITGPIAKVNGVAIGSEEFYAERDKITSRGAKIPADRLARIEQNILKRLIEKELISLAVKKSSIVVPEADVAAGFEEYKKRFQNEEQFENYLKHGRVTRASIEERIRDRRALELLLESKGDMGVTDEEAKDFYGKNERFYTEKSGVRASHILIKVPQKADDAAVAKAQEKIKAAQDALAKGDDFGEVAKKMSEGPSAPKGGDLGFFGEGRMVKEFQDAAFAMKVGETTKEAVRTRFGFHIIKVTDKREERKKTLDEVKDQIVKSLKNKKFFTERRKVLAGLEKEAKIEKFLPEPPPAPPGAKTPAHPGPNDHKLVPGGGHEHKPGDGHDHK